MTQTCRYCQCTELRACPGGCSWVAPSVCSSCVENQCTDILEAAQAWARQNGVGPGRRTAMLADRPCTIEADESGIAVRDHLGVYVFTADATGVWRAMHYEPDELMAVFGTQKRKAA